MILCRLLISPEHRYTWNFALGWNFQFQPSLKKICFTREFQPGAIRISLWNFQFQPGLKKICFTREFQPGAIRMYFIFISPRGENIFAKICGIFYKKMFYGKKHLLYAITRLYKTMMLDFINKRSKTFNFKTFHDTHREKLYFTQLIA